MLDFLWHPIAFIKDSINWFWPVGEVTPLETIIKPLNKTHVPNALRLPRLVRYSKVRHKWS